MEADDRDVLYSCILGGDGLDIPFVAANHGAFAEVGGIYDDDDELRRRRGWWKIGT